MAKAPGQRLLGKVNLNLRKERKCDILVKLKNFSLLGEKNITGGIYKMRETGSDHTESYNKC